MPMPSPQKTREITPTEYEGVKLVSFGFAGQGAAIMRGVMVSGLVQQLLLTAKWGELDYLVIDMPPGTGDVQVRFPPALNTHITSHRIGTRTDAAP